MMNFVSAPVTFQREENALSVVRNIEDVVAMIDNLVELIVFTPRGSFTADPDSDSSTGITNTRTYPIVISTTDTAPCPVSEMTRQQKKCAKTVSETVWRPMLRS